MASSDTVVRFGDCELDRAALELRRNGEPVAVEPQVFDVLQYLVDHRERVVAKTELLDNVWGDRFVSESALTSRIKSVRQAVGDDGRRQAVVRTAHGRGYQFVAEVDGTVDPGRPTTSMRPESGGLVGRDDEIGTVERLLADHQLVTITGSGGVGKTALATTVARAWEDSGTRSLVVHLDGVDDSSRVPSAICDAAGLRAETDVDLVAALAEGLRGEPALLVLDNFEQVTDAAPAVGRLIGDLPDLRVLVTSRERLRLSGEHTLQLDPLAAGRSADGPSPASALFERAARRADPAFELTADNEPIVVDLCELLDGLPLAIELAAAQLHYLPLEFLSTHLRSNLDAIESDVRDRPTRQRSMTELISWSHALLTPAQQRLLARLSVFQGGSPLDGARIVGGLDTDRAAIVAVSELVDKSLVRLDRAGASPRYAMLDLIRRFAAEELARSGDDVAAARDHAVWVAGAVREVDEARWTADAGGWIDRLNLEAGNVSAALERSQRADDLATLGAIVGDLNVWWYRSGRHAEGRHWFDVALGSIDAFDDPTAGRVHLGAGFTAFADRDVARARAHYERAEDHAERAGDWRFLQVARANLGGTAIGDPDEMAAALGRLDAVVAEARQREELAVLAHALNVSGVLLRMSGQADAADARLRAALDVNRTTGDRYQQAMNLANLGHLAVTQGDAPAALGWSREALHLSWRIGSQVMSAWVLAEIARALQLDGSLEAGARLLGASDAVLDAIGAHRGPTAHQSAHDETVEALRTGLGERRAEELLGDGRSLSLEAAVGLALDG